MTQEATHHASDEKFTGTGHGYLRIDAVMQMAAGATATGMQPSPQTRIERESPTLDYRKWRLEGWG